MTQYERYESYLLRLWQTTEGGHAVWHGSLEAVSDGHRYGFATPDALMAFLRARMDGERPPDLPPDARHES
jgi:hypothetical protein